MHAVALCLAAASASWTVPPPAPLRTPLRRPLPSPGRGAVLLRLQDNEAVASPYGSLALLGVGDVAAFALFAAIGRAEHASEAGSIIGTAAPFVAAWIVTAPFLGAYRREVSKSLRDAVITPLPAWAVAVPAGCALRGVFEGHVPPTPFWGVSLVATLALLTAWRAAHFLVVDQRVVQPAASLDDAVSGLVAGAAGIAVDSATGSLLDIDDDGDDEVDPFDEVRQIDVKVVKEASKAVKVASKKVKRSSREVDKVVKESTKTVVDKVVKGSPLSRAVTDAALKPATRDLLGLDGDDE